MIAVMTPRPTAKLGPDFYCCPVLELAPALLGCILARRLDGIVTRARIVEVEAYHQDGDAAAHSFGGPTRRNGVMFGPAGRLYVYLIYGMHHCMNIVAEDEGVGAAVLLRALEPLEGVAGLRARRAVTRDRDLTNGPGKLCAALGVDLSHNGLDLQGDELWLEHDDALLAPIVRSRRIGITKSADLPWRFHLAGHPCVSRP